MIFFYVEFFGKAKRRQQNSHTVIWGAWSGLLIYILLTPSDGPTYHMMSTIYGCYYARVQSAQEIHLGGNNYIQAYLSFTFVEAMQPRDQFQLI